MSDSPKISGQPDDRELEEFLAGRGPIGLAYRDSRAGETAPPELDTAVLRLAEQALQDPVQKPERWRSLRLPVALAATVVLSFSTFLMLREERGAASMMEFAPVTAPASAPTEEVGMDAAAPAQIQKAESKSAPPPAPRPGRMEKKERARASAAVAAESERALRSGRFAEEDSVGSSAQPLARKAMPPAPAAAPAAAGMTSNSAPAELQDQIALEPDEWIGRIRQLRDASQPDQARIELEALLKAYPQYVVPKDLKSLSPAPSPSP